MQTAPTTMKRHLFGGALRSAGLVAAATMTTTAAAEFVPLATPEGGVDSQLHVFAYNTTGASVDNYASTPLAAFNPTQSYFGPGLAMSAYADASVMGVSFSLTDPIMWDTIAYATAIQWFTVDTTKQARFKWDVVGASLANGYVYQVGVGIITPIANEGTSGSVMLTFLSSETYGFAGQIVSFGAESDGYIRLSWVPAPGALGLLGLGMVGVKRRRRE